MNGDWRLADVVLDGEENVAREGDRHAAKLTAAVEQSVHLVKR